MSFERVMGPNRHNIENYGDLQPIARSMQATLCVPSENLSFGLLPKLRYLYIEFESTSWSNPSGAKEGIKF